GPIPFRSGWYYRCTALPLCRREVGLPVGARRQRGAVCERRPRQQRLRGLGLGRLSLELGGLGLRDLRLLLAGLLGLGLLLQVLGGPRLARRIAAVGAVEPAQQQRDRQRERR